MIILQNTISGELYGMRNAFESANDTNPAATLYPLNNPSFTARHGHAGIAYTDPRGSTKWLSFDGGVLTVTDKRGFTDVYQIWIQSS